MFSLPDLAQAITRRNWLRHTAAGALAMGGCAAVSAQSSWPQKPVTLIVANAAGAPVDVAIRLIAKELEAGALTAKATLRLASRVRGIEHHLVMGRR